MVYTRHHLLGFLQIARKQRILADQRAVHFRKPNQATKPAMWVFADTRAMRLEPADDFLTRSKLLSQEHPPPRLFDQLPDALEHLSERLRQFAGLLGWSESATRPPAAGLDPPSRS